MRTNFAFSAFGLAFAAAAMTLSNSASADSLATGAPATNFTIGDYATGLGATTDMAWTPDGRMVATSKNGTVYVRKTDGTVVTAGNFAVDSSSEKGLLGVAVHPSFATNKTLFFYYSADSSIGGTDLDRHRVVSVVLKDDSTLDKTTEKILLRNLRGPANHDGGALAIGPDGKLYVGVGDTGCNSNVAPGGTITNYFGTCLTVANGKILRINLDGTIPTDNPLVGIASATACGPGGYCASENTPISATSLGAPRTEIWAWGFRNPWRFNFDAKTGLLWVGDVGEVTYEEVTIAKKGAHHGWPWREGFHGYPVTKCNDVTPKGDCIDPVYDCIHGAGTATEDGGCTAITGGVVDDWCTFPAAFQGLYYFADSSVKKMWTLTPNAARDGLASPKRTDFASFDNAPVSIRKGPDGGIYVALLDGGRVVRIAAKSPATCPGGTDAGPVDTGPGTDTGTPGTDTGTPGTDTGTPGTDTGTPGSDASIDDATTSDDGGAGDSGSSGGCGCSVPGTETTTFAWPMLGAIGALAALVRRRRR